MRRCWESDEEALSSSLRELSLDATQARPAIEETGGGATVDSDKETSKVVRPKRRQPNEVLLNVDPSKKNGKLSCHLNQLPSEVLLHIFSFLSEVELCRRVAPVCCAWAALAQDPSLWTRLDFSKYPTTEERAKKLVAGAPRLVHLELQSHQDDRELLLLVGANCPRLKHLTLKFCTDVTEEAMKAVIQGCPELQYLNLEGSPSTKTQCYHLLAKLTHLISLNLSYCRHLDDKGLLTIAQHCRGLQYLNVDEVTGIHDCSVVGLSRLLAGNLRQLYLDGENLTDASYQALAACKKLERLGVSFCERLTDKGLTGLSSLTNLTWLKLRKGTQLQPAGLRKLFQNKGLANLTYLNLGECTLLDDTVMAAIASCCPDLLHLELNWCWDVTDAGLALVAAGCPMLCALVLVGVVQLTSSILPILLEVLPCLQFLDFEQCSAIDDDSLQTFVAQRPSLTVCSYWGDTVVAPESGNSSQQSSRQPSPTLEKND